MTLYIHNNAYVIASNDGCRTELCISHSDNTAVRLTSYDSNNEVDLRVEFPREMIKALIAGLTYLDTLPK